VNRTTNANVNRNNAKRHVNRGANANGQKWQPDSNRLKNSGSTMSQLAEPGARGYGRAQARRVRIGRLAAFAAAVPHQLGQESTAATGSGLDDTAVIVDPEFFNRFESGCHFCPLALAPRFTLALACCG